MLILRTLLYGPAHGHQIGNHIPWTANDFLQMQHGSLYPALHRLERRGWVVSNWETAPERNREFKYHRRTVKGKKHVVVEESQWKQMSEAVGRVMWPTAEGPLWSAIRLGGYLRDQVDDAATTSRNLAWANLFSSGSPIVIRTQLA